MSFETLLYEKQDRIATLTLNRPERRNAFNHTMAEELGQAWEAIKADPEVACVILTGAGDKALCTGVDVTSVVEAGGFDRDDMPAEEPPFLNMTAVQNQCWKPVITAVNGMVCGGGLHFIADSDIIVCAENATFFDTHVRLGVISGLEPVGLARRIPLEAVMRLALLGGSERMTAQEALNLGLVGEVVPQRDLMPRARALARKIAAHSPTALARSKQAIWQSLEMGLDDALKNAWELIRTHTQHPDHSEGPRAMVEKREPKWAPYIGL
ncbi:MAG: enoyl-CoA hydratase/isomerase family protein [Deltaproteobacteria bacterium]|jgi:enoyl-CoA hydratase/carnithine racemase|nr:enoyl-CoA hydratase/isomerase family protein [Deltaproteobacteria bacterium]